MRRAAERVLVDRVTWLAMSAPNGQVRAIASLKLQRLAARLRAGGRPRREADQAQHTLLAADIKRFLERPIADGSDDPHGRRAAGRADRRHRPGLARVADVVRVGRGVAERVDVLQPPF